MAATTGLITVAEFEKIPNPPGGAYELRNGELAFVPYPPKIHQEIQMAIAFALQPRIGKNGHVGVELGFKPTPEYNQWAADVAFVTRSRWVAIANLECLAGAPDLVIEVISPSNRTLELNRRETVCLANGCKQFWTVDPDLNIIKVTTPDRKTITYGVSEKIELSEFGGRALKVAEVFAGEFEGGG